MRRSRVCRSDGAIVRSREADGELPSGRLDGTSNQRARPPPPPPSASPPRTAVPVSSLAAAAAPRAAADPSSGRCRWPRPPAEWRVRRRWEREVGVLEASTGGRGGGRGREAGRADALAPAWGHEAKARGGGGGGGEAVARARRWSPPTTPTPWQKSPPGTRMCWRHRPRVRRRPRGGGWRGPGVVAVAVAVEAV